MAHVRTRFAPSPTGELHIGGARTALFNYLFAKRFNGSFIVRIEDTDIERSKRHFEDSLLNDLKWLGLDWDEGPDIGGGCGPYRQSERLHIYRSYSDLLVQKGLAYPCYCSRERLKELKELQIKTKTPARYDNRCRGLKKGDLPEDVSSVVRFKVPEETVKFHDALHGDLSFDARGFGDFVILGSDGAASYNFAVVIDDCLMKVSHIIRGDDHLSNTPRQMLISEALGFEIPEYCHIPLVLSMDKTPLGKREGGSSIAGMREGGLLSQAVINAIARLGWAPDEGISTLEGLVASFDLKRLSKSPSVFDMGRLMAFNRSHIEGMALTGLLNCAFPEAAGSKDEAWVKDALNIARKDAFTINDLREMLMPLFGGVEPTEDARLILTEPGSNDVIKALWSEINAAEQVDAGSADEIISRLKEKTGLKGGKLMLPLRAALTGRTKGIELAAVLRLLGKKKIMERLKQYGA